MNKFTSELQIRKQYNLQMQNQKGKKQSLPTPPEAPMTRTSLEEEERVVWELWVVSEFVDWITSAFTDSPLKPEFFLEKPNP